MRSHLAIRNLTTALSGVVLIGLALTGAAYAITSAAFRYPAPQTGYLMIPAAAFEAQTNNVVYINSGNFIDSAGTGCFTAPVNLPQRAKMTQLAMWYTKNDAVAVNLELRRAAPADGNSVLVAQLPVATNTAGAVKLAAAAITDASLQTVNNVRFSYYITECLSDAQFFLGARIRYTYTTAGD